MNIKITNIETNHSMIVTKQVFKTIKDLLSEDSVYVETDEPITYDGGIINKTN